MYTYQIRVSDEIITKFLWLLEYFKKDIEIIKIESHNDFMIDMEQSRFGLYFGLNRLSSLIPSKKPIKQLLPILNTLIYNPFFLHSTFKCRSIELSIYLRNSYEDYKNSSD